MENAKLICEALNEKKQERYELFVISICGELTEEVDHQQLIDEEGYSIKERYYG